MNFGKCKCCDPPESRPCSKINGKALQMLLDDDWQGGLHYVNSYKSPIGENVPVRPSSLRALQDQAKRAINRVGPANPQPVDLRDYGLQLH